MRKDRIDDPVTGFLVGEAAEDPGSTPDLPEGSFDHVGGSYSLPVHSGEGIDA